MFWIILVEYRFKVTPQKTHMGTDRDCVAALHYPLLRNEFSGENIFQQPYCQISRMRCGPILLESHRDIRLDIPLEPVPRTL